MPQIECNKLSGRGLLKQVTRLHLGLGNIKVSLKQSLLMIKSDKCLSISVLSATVSFDTFRPACSGRKMSGLRTWRYISDESIPCKIFESDLSSS